VSTSLRVGVGTFSSTVRIYLRRSGYSQKELAAEIGLNAKVLSRKLNGSGNALLTDQEVRRIIKILAHWRAITTQDEVLQLLELAQVDPSSISPDEWASLDLTPSEFAPGRLVTKRGSRAYEAPFNNSLAPSIPLSSNSSNYRGNQHNLPAPTTRLIGRQGIVVRLRHLLEREDVRLVTLVGSGGSGKTRLALHVANDLVSAFSHGVWFVALGGVNDPALVPMSIFQALHISPASDVPQLQGLINYLRNKQLLLVLDNFEQLVEVSTVVDELLAGAPDLKVLVTSRVVLHLNGEHEFSVPPLDLPDLDIAQDATALSHYGAIQLFVERAQAVKPDFALTAQNSAVIAQICAKVDGLPLALELAAARVKVFPPALLLEWLSQKRLPVLTKGPRNLPARQQTLRNTITWSYNLLSKAEQVWFARLGVFTGGWSLEAAEAMMLSWIKIADWEETTDSVSPAEMLELLVDNSLLVRLPTTDGESRFTMLETLHEFALEQLTLQGEFERLRDWHACYYLEVAEAAERGLRGPRQLEWLGRFTADRGNFRAAFEWSLQRARDGMRVHCNAELLAVEVCLRLASGLRHYWEWQGNLVEARYLLGEALGVPIGAEVGKSLLAARAKALSEASRLACLQNDQDRAVALAEESIAIAQQLKDPIRVAGAQLHRGWAAQGMGEYEAAKDAYQKGLEQLSINDDPWMRAQLLFHLAAAIGFTYDFEQMRLYYSQGKELFEQLGDKSSVADLLKDQGAIALLEGDCVRAIDGLLTSLKLCYELGHKQHLTTGMCWLSLAIGMSSHPDPVTASIHSAKLEAVTENLEEIVGLTGWTKTHPLIQMARQHIRSQVDEQSWQAAWNEGRRLTIEQAIELASRFRDGLCSSIHLAQP
jgi:predicted ATPase/transcriptional regulator with XRE-family HTH domain